MPVLTEPVYHSLISGRPVAGTDGTIRATDPSTDALTGPEFSLVDTPQIAQATGAAADAFTHYRSTSPQERSAFLHTVADHIEARGDDIVATAMTETGLPEPRLRGELARTANQLRLMGKAAGSGDTLGVRIEEAMPDRKPLPRPDLRQLRIPLGPVAVFGASNFPLAFSVGGGDTASALAAGCPVVVKAHSAHPGTSQLVAQAITEAVADHGLPSGVFSLIYGRGAYAGQALVRDPRIAAVGFTGSRSGGTALMETAAARPTPIPVYAEMSSVNPIFVLPSAIADPEARGALAEGFVASLTGSAGQLCTAPGLLFIPSGDAGDACVDAISRAVSAAVGTTMLTPSIREARDSGAADLAASAGVSDVGRGTEGVTSNSPAPAVYSTDARTFASSPELAEEVFGSVCLVVRFDSVDELLEIVDQLDGQLTATLQVSIDNEADLASAHRLLRRLELTVGRILVGGWPTGVDVGDAIVHGGPFPATSDGRSTSVGTLAIARFLRPIVLQNVPSALLPPAVEDANPWNLTRRIDGKFVLRTGEAS